MSDQKPPPKGPGGDKGGGAKKPFGPPKAPPAPTGIDGVLAEIILAFVAFAIILPYLYYSFFVSKGSGISEFLLNVYEFTKTVSTVISMVALVIVIYAYVRISEISSAENKKLGLTLSWDSERKQKNVRWERVEQYMTSLNPSDWKIAILESDNILDDIVERIGYKGATLGERLKNIESSDFPYLEEAWQAHKLRNALAHKGTNYELTRSEAEQAINIYNRIFKSLGYL